MEQTWQRYCGFLDISIEEFMQIQRSLLHDQLKLVADSPLTTKLTGEIPTNLEKFRSIVPLTTYDDYTDYLNNHNEASLNVKPAYWIFTSWTRGTYKWIPWAARFDKVSCQHLIAALIIASASRKGEVNLQPKDKMLLTIPPRPFASASLAFSMLQCSSFQPILSLDEAERVTLKKKIELEFNQALAKDIDFVICMSSILHRTTEEYIRLFSTIKPSWRLLFRMHINVLFRLVCAFIRGRVGNGLLPKDLWSPKAILSWGTETAIYQDELSERWGKSLYQFYVTSEAGFLATQSWTRRGLTFFPDSAFLEFIPQDDGASQKTLLLDELESGKLYELVVTSFYGMPFLRCRLGDLIRVVSLADDQAGINLPQITIEGRNDQVIDLHSIARLDTETISMAMNGSEVDCKYWVVCKEYDHGDPILRFYIELEENTDHLPDKIHRCLKTIDKHYREAVYTMKNNPIRVTSLPKGSLQHSNLNHQVNVSTSVLQQLNSIRRGGA
jgi:hypothetical protein